MTLDEAIKHAENVALNRENGLYDAIALGGQNPSQEEIDECMKCAEEHRQLAAWLKELKMYKSADEQDDNRLYIRIYADDEPSRKAEKLYQICGETESQEVAQWLKEYFPSVDRPTGWIPVSKRLPTPPTFCLVTTDGSHGDVIDIALYMSDGWHKASEVLAWMPLPPPYEGGDEHE